MTRLKFTEYKPPAAKSVVAVAALTDDESSPPRQEISSVTSTAQTSSEVDNHHRLPSSSSLSSPLLLPAKTKTMKTLKFEKKGQCVMSTLRMPRGKQWYESSSSHQSPTLFAKTASSLASLASTSSTYASSPTASSSSTSPPSLLSCRRVNRDFTCPTARRILLDSSCTVPRENSTETTTTLEATSVDFSPSHDLNSRQSKNLCTSAVVVDSDVSHQTKAATSDSSNSSRSSTPCDSSLSVRAIKKAKLDVDSTSDHLPMITAVETTMNNDVVTTTTTSMTTTEKRGKRRRESMEMEMNGQEDNCERSVIDMGTHVMIKVNYTECEWIRRAFQCCPS